MKVYFDKKLIKKEYLSFLAPLLWCPDFDIRWEDKAQIKDRHETGKQSLTFANEKECDYFVYPKYFLLDHFNELKEYAKKAKKHNKSVLVFSYWEIDDYIDVEDNTIRFKRSTKKENPDNEYCLPPFPEDFLKYNDGKIPLIHESAKKEYSVGYVGYADFYDLKSRLYYIGVRIIGKIFRRKPAKRLLMKIRSDKIYGQLVNAWIGNYCRGRAIKSIKKMKGYVFHFIQRNHALTTATKDEMRKQYIQNMISSDFVLLVRGFWNYSIRQYEVLSLGKIPIYIDTWAKLPFPERIAYKDMFITIPIWDIRNIQKYMDAYIKRNAWHLAEIQKDIRKTYEGFFVMKEYYRKIIDILKK